MRRFFREHGNGGKQSRVYYAHGGHFIKAAPCKFTGAVSISLRGTPENALKKYASCEKRNTRYTHEITLKNETETAGFSLRETDGAFAACAEYLFETAYTISKNAITAAMIILPIPVPIFLNAVLTRFSNAASLEARSGITAARTGNAIKMPITTFLLALFFNEKPQYPPTTAPIFSAGVLKTLFAASPSILARRGGEARPKFRTHKGQKG